MAETNGNGSSARWSAWAGVGTLALALIGSLFVLYATSIGAAKDVSSLSVRVGALEERISAQRVEITTLETKNTEIETQFRSSDQIRNLMHASDLRITAMLWKKTFGMDYPISNSYYPSIAQSPPQQP
jgi:hypothetical protein